MGAARQEKYEKRKLCIAGTASDSEAVKKQTNYFPDHIRTVRMNGIPVLFDQTNKPDKNAGAARADQNAGNPSGRADADQTAKPAAYSAAYEPKNNVAKQASVAFHNLAGEPAGYSAD